jgi:hypothetical protein
MLDQDHFHRSEYNLISWSLSYCTNNIRFLLNTYWRESIVLTNCFTGSESELRVNSNFILCQFIKILLGMSVYSNDEIGLIPLP